MNTNGKALPHAEGLLLREVPLQLEIPPQLNAPCSALTHWLVAILTSLALAGASAQTPTAANPPVFSPFVTSSSQVAAPVSAVNRGGGGCANGAKSSSGTASWSNNGAEEIPGIYYATLLIKCRNDRTVVIWTDMRTYFGPGGELHHEVIPEPSTPEQWGRAGRFTDGEGLNYQLLVSNESGGHALFDDQYYDLQAGDLFLVALRQGKFFVRQLDLNLTRIPAPDVKLMALTNQEIKEFFIDPSILEK